MKVLRIWMMGASLLALVLASCAPAPTPSEEPGVPADYPVEPEEPSSPAQPSAPVDYPITPAQPGQAVDVIGAQVYNSSPRASTEELQAMAEANNAFALDLYKQLGEGNLFFSPYSIYQALMMAYAGAQNQTASQMAAVLRLPAADARVHEIMNALSQTLTASTLKEGAPVFAFNVANALWGQQGYGFQEDFLNQLSANYAAGLKTVDFTADAEGARQLINLWVEAQTNDKIKDLIPQGVLNAMTRLVLTNAVYFKAAWLTQFDPEATVNGDFYLADGSAVSVPMMRLVSNMYKSVQPDLTMVELPYKGNTYSMVVLMPTQGSLAEFEKGLDAQMLANLLARLENGYVDLSMPKFKLESGFGLSEQMKQLGMTDAFSADSADFSGMDGTTNLYITDMLHKAFVEVNEEGTEAAAATAIVVGIKSIPNDQLTIKIDHPFMFLIREKATNTVIFIGRVTQP